MDVENFLGHLHVVGYHWVWTRQDFFSDQRSYVSAIYFFGISNASDCYRTIKQTIITHHTCKVTGCWAAVHGQAMMSSSCIIPLPISAERPIFFQGWRHLRCTSFFNNGGERKISFGNVVLVQVVGVFLKNHSSIWGLYLEVVGFSVILCQIFFGYLCKRINVCNVHVIKPRFFDMSQRYAFVGHQLLSSIHAHSTAFLNFPDTSWLAHSGVAKHVCGRLAV